MKTPLRQFPNFHVLDHPLIQHKLSLMRDKAAPTILFRQLLKEIALLMGYEVTRDLPMTQQPIETPVAPMIAPTIAGKKIAVVAILRAGLGMAEAMIELIPAARVGHIGLYRDPKTKRPVQYFDLDAWQDSTGPHDVRYARVPDVQWIVPENWHPESGAVYASGGLTWGALWLPAVIMRNFWPVGEHHFLLRPGGHLRLKWGDRWDVVVDEDRAVVNGRSLKLTERATYLVDEACHQSRVLDFGKADPVVIDREGIL